MNTKLILAAFAACCACLFGEEPKAAVVEETAAIKDLTLEQALDLAAGKHPELSYVQAKVEAAGGRIVQAKAFPNPEFILRNELMPVGGAKFSDSELITGFSQRLPIGGRLSAARQVEEASRERWLRESAVRAWEIRKGVHNAFAAALYAQQIIERQAETQAYAERGLQIAKARKEAGDATADEVAQAEMEQVRALLEVEKARALRTQSLVALIGAMGNHLLRISSLKGDVTAAFEVPQLESVVKKLDSLPQFAAADADIAVERSRLRLAEAERIPDINLDLLYHRIGEQRRNTIDAGISISIPLFDQNKGKIREARAEIAAAEAKSRSARITLEQQIRVAHAQLSRALTTANRLRDEIIPRAKSILEAAENRYNAGDTALTPVLIARRDFANTQLSYLEALREVMEAWAALTPFVSK